MGYGSYRDTWVNVSLDNIFNNSSAFKKAIKSTVKLMAVVKADGYGHGSVEIAKTSLKAGADYLAVAIVDEAIILREAGITDPILVLGSTPLAAIEKAVQYDLTLTVYTSDAVKKLDYISEKMKKPARIHLKIDSGMNRIGIHSKEEALVIAGSIQSQYVELEGIFTHFADADDPASDFVHQQFEQFTSIVSFLEQHQIHIPIKHCCNTAATIAFPEMHLDMVRVGIGLYGLYPEETMREKITLKQAMSFKTRPVMVKTVPAEKPVSYGRTFYTEKESVIATIPVGYADGFSRALSNKGSVTVKGKKAPIVGRVCMDQTMIDVTDIGPVDLAEEVTLFGEPSDGFIYMGEVADHMNTIHYEVACLIGKRVPRVYTRNGQVVHTQ